MTLKRGAYRIQWNSGCQLVSKDYQITSVSMPVGHRNIDGWTVPQSAVDLIKHFQLNSYPTVLPPIIPLDLTRLPHPADIHWTDTHHLSTLILWLVITGLGVSLAVLVFKIYRPWHAPTCCRRAATMTGADQEPEVVQAGSPLPQSAPLYTLSTNN